MKFLALTDCPQGQQAGDIFEATEDAGHVLELVGAARRVHEQIDPSADAPTEATTEQPATEPAVEPAPSTIPRRRYRRNDLTAQD